MWMFAFPMWLLGCVLYIVIVALVLALSWRCCCYPGAEKLYAAASNGNKNNGNKEQENSQLMTTTGDDLHLIRQE